MIALTYLYFYYTQSPVFVVQVSCCCCASLMWSLLINRIDNGLLKLCLPDFLPLLPLPVSICS